MIDLIPFLILSMGAIISMPIIVIMYYIVKMEQ